MRNKLRKENINMKIVKGILNVVMAFLITLLILANFVVNVFNHTILNKEYMISQLEEKGYTQKIETDLKNEFENYQYQSGLPEEVFANLYTTDMITQDLDSMVNSIYDGTQITNHAEEIRNKIRENINAYLAQNDITLPEEGKENVAQFEDLMIEVYEEKINMSSQMIKKIAKVETEAEMIVKVVKIGLIIGLIALLLFTVLLNRKTVASLLNTLLISVLSSGIVLKLVPWVMESNIDINHILILNQTLSDFIKDIATGILEKFDFYGFVLIAIGMIGIVGNHYNRVKNGEQKKIKKVT